MKDKFLALAVMRAYLVVFVIFALFLLHYAGGIPAFSTNTELTNPSRRTVSSTLQQHQDTGSSTFSASAEGQAGWPANYGQPGLIQPSAAALQQAADPSKNSTGSGLIRRTLNSSQQQQDTGKIASTQMDTQQIHPANNLEPGLSYLANYYSAYSCTSPVASKQSCIFHNVCLMPREGDPQSLTVVRLQGSTAVGMYGADAVLKQQLDVMMQGLYSVHVYALDDATREQAGSTGKRSTSDSRFHPLAHKLWLGAVDHDGSNSRHPGAVRLTRTPAKGQESPIVLLEDKLTVISKPGINQYSFGHALGNTLLPLFLMLSNHIPPHQLPPHLRVLFAAGGWEAHPTVGESILSATAKATLGHDIDLLPNWISSKQRDGLVGVCFRNLVLGDGGYEDASVQTIGGNALAKQATQQPSMYDSKTWEAFRDHAFRVSDIMPSAIARKRPLVVLNDKRYHKDGTLTTDKRIILDIDDVATKIDAAFPQADVLVVKFRDMPMVEQVQIMSAASVFITTAGSSSFLAVFMPSGSHVIYLGAPETEKEKEEPWRVYTSFNELDRWLPLTYVQFMRYETDIEDNASYVIEVLPGMWEPSAGELRDRWRLYNANLRVDMVRLLPMLDQAMGSRS